MTGTRGLRRRLAALLVCAPGALAAGAPAAAQQPAARGHLFIVGGGARPPEMMRRFVELAGGDSARILVLPMASADAEGAGESNASTLRGHGARATSLVLDRTAADALAVDRAFDGVTGVWFPGGVQSRLMEVLRGTRAAAAVRRVYENGGVVGGTSAGAAVMSGAMITGDERRPGGDRPTTEDAFLTIERDNIVTVAGLELLPDAIVDQHFVRRKRHNRLISLVLENPGMIGAGIDESTALEVAPDGTWRVVGRSVVVIYDARDASITPAGGVLGGAGLRMHVLPAGATFDPRTGRATLAPADGR